MTGRRRESVVFTNRYFYPDQSATSQMLTDLAFALAEKGHQVKVVASRQRYCLGGDPLPAQETVAGVEIHRVWTTDLAKRFGLIGKAFDYLTFLLAATFALLRLLRAGDTVVAKTDPPMLSVLVTPVAWLRRAAMVNWWQDVFPEVAEVMVRRRAWLVPVFDGLRSLRNLAMRSARMNVVIGDRMAGYMRSQGLADDRVRVIPNWSDGKLVAPSEAGALALRRQWGLEDRFVVAYSGNLGRAHDGRTIIDAIAELERAPVSGAAGRIAWLFVGGGAEFAKLKREVAERGLRTVTFQPYQPRELLADSLSVADVHIVSLRPEFEGLIVPSKFYGIAAAGRATVFIGDTQGEIARTLDQHGCGRNVALGDSAGLAGTVAAMAADRTATRAMGVAARQTFERLYDKAFAVESWHAMLDALAASQLRAAATPEPAAATYEWQAPAQPQPGAPASLPQAPAAPPVA